MKKYYTNDGKLPLGPFSIEELKAHNPTPEMPIWAEGMPEWTILKNVPELQILLGSVPPPIQPNKQEKVASLPNNIVMELPPEPKSSNNVSNEINNDTTLPIEPALEESKVTFNKEAAPINPSQNEKVPPKKKSGMSSKKFYAILFGVLVLAVIVLYVASKLMYGTSVTKSQVDSSTVGNDSLAQVKQNLEAQQHRLDSTQIALAQSQQLHEDSLKNAAIAQERVDSSYRRNWRKYIAISKTFNSDDFWGGISNVQISVVNGLPYMIDLIEFKIQYIKKNGDVYDERTISQSKIASDKQISIDAPDSDRGVTVEVEITKIISTDLKLNYSI